MNTKNLAASLLPVVFALASLGTVGCAADSETSASGDAVTHEPSEAVAPVEALAGSAGTPSVVEPEAAPDAQAGKAAATMRLVATDSSTNVTATYEVLAFDLGVDVPQATTSATSGASVAKPTLRPLQVVVRPNATSALLGQRLVDPRLLAKVVLQRVAADGTVKDVAQLDKALVRRMLDVAGDTTRETYEIQGATLTAMHEGLSVTLDSVAGTTSCAAVTGGCPCDVGTLGQLGPYTQAGPLGSISKGSTRVDQLRVELHTVVSGSGALAYGKAALDGVSFDASLETSGLCAMYYAGKGRRVNDVHLGVAGPTAVKGTTVESTSWDACLANVNAVGISATSATAPMREQVTLGARGLVRTDRTLAPLTGLQVGKDLVSGWSFVTGSAITSCSETLTAAP